MAGTDETERTWKAVKEARIYSGNWQTGICGGDMVGLVVKVGIELEGASYCRSV